VLQPSEDHSTVIAVTVASDRNVTLNAMFLDQVFELLHHVCVKAELTQEILHWLCMSNVGNAASLSPKGIQLKMVTTGYSLGCLLRT
jgi:hypothetical protein